MEYKLEELTKRVDKHNNTIERTYNLEQRMAVSEEQIRVANHRIADLEHDHKVLCVCCNYCIIRDLYGSNWRLGKSKDNLG